MAITWAQALDYDKVTIVPHNGSYTRTLIEKSGYFAVQIPTAAQAELVSEMGAENNSRFDNADKMKNVEIFYKDDSRVPLIAGCADGSFASVPPSLITSRVMIFSSARSSRRMRTRGSLTAGTGCLKRSLTS